MSYAEFKVTQGGGDTAAETSVSTLIIPGSSKFAWEVTAVEAHISPDLLKTWAAADADMTLQVMKRSLSGSIVRVTDYGDDDLIASVNLAAIASGTPATLQVAHADVVRILPMPRLVYAPSIYIQLISNSTGATNIVWGRIFYQQRKISQGQTLELLGGSMC